MAMTCKRHPYEVGVGVCASCLRERLFTLIAEQNKLASAAGVTDDYHRRSDPNPSSADLHFPRSVSPYFSHRRSLGSDAPASNSRLNRFFSTPPAGHLFSADDTSFRRPHRSFSLWSAVFGHSRSESSEPRSSFSWLSALIRRKKSRKLFEAATSSQPLEQGLSPARYREEENEGDSGCSSDSSPVRRLPGPTPIRHAAARHSSSGGRAISGFVVCLSPLVRSNPNRRRGYGQSDATLSGEPRSSINDHQIRRHVSLGDPGSVGLNRSRRLADFGRFK